MSFKEQYTKTKTTTANKLSNAQKLSIIATVVIVGVLGVTLMTSTSEKTNTVDLTQNEQTQVDEQRKREVITGSAIATEDQSEIRIRLYVDNDHEFKEIWADYSDDINKLDESAGTISQPPLDTPEDSEVHEVFVDINTIESDKRYYYQAVGRDSEDNTVYGKIASFSLENR